MTKLPIQRSLATLSESDLETLAKWLRQETYESVLKRVNSPRPQGMGLNISVKPLQTFFAKVAMLDLVNLRLPEEKKINLLTYLSLGSGALNLDPETLARLSEKCATAHEAIIQTAHDLATAGENSPAQLLTLQRIVDFPARCEIRQQQLELQLQKQAEQADRSLVQKFFACERIKLAKENLAFRKKQHEDKMALAQAKAKKAEANNTAPQTRKSDRLGPFATNREELRARVRKQFGITEEEAARRAELRKTWKDPNVYPNCPGENQSPALNL